MESINIKESTIETLLTELESAQINYQDLLYNHAVAPLEKTHNIKISRKYIARLKTEIRSRELSTLDISLRDKIISRRRRQK